MDTVLLVGATSFVKDNYPFDPILMVPELVRKVLEDANRNLIGYQLSIADINMIISGPPSSHPRPLAAHWVAFEINLFEERRKRFSTEDEYEKNEILLKTIEAGGATPIVALKQATEHLASHPSLALLIFFDSPASAPRSQILLHNSLYATESSASPPSTQPLIPIEYNKVARWHMTTFDTTREQLALVPVLMSNQAHRHNSVPRPPLTLDTVLASRQIASVTTQLECARLTNGGGAALLASASWLRKKKISLKSPSIQVAGLGEASGPRKVVEPIHEVEISGCRLAAQRAFRQVHRIQRLNPTRSGLCHFTSNKSFPPIQSCFSEPHQANLSVTGIDWFGLYDCFPVAFIKAVEDVGLAPPGKGGKWVEETHLKFLASNKSPPINTHGGLLGLGAPHAVPAMFTLVEAVRQLRGEATNQIQRRPTTALVHGNGGIFSASAVAILRAVEDTSFTPPPMSRL